ncbi:hypothetical protein ACWCQ1_45360 [Streptomyces sp. NPDC002144]
MEATADYWRGVYYVLQPHLNLMLVNPAHLKGIRGRKSDPQRRGEPAQGANSAPCAARSGHQGVAPVQSAECRVKDRLSVFRGTGDLRDGHHEVEDLVEVEVAGDLVCVLGDGEQRLAGREHPAPGLEDGIGCVRVFMQPEDDRPLGGDVLERTGAARS